jgi:ATP-dependent Clp protease ATP-binding subunit ClpC
MSEYQEQHSISRLIGSPPGYVGHEEGGQLTEQVKNKPYCVILLDEVEKANKNIYQAFLQMLDDGHLTDGLGRKINFKNCIVIMTSNLGVRKLQEFGTGMGFSTGDKKYAEEEQKREILKKELQKFFAPEFLNRIDEVIFFNKLSKENVKEIVKLEVEKLIQRIKKINYHFLIDDSVVELIAEVGFDENYGARPLKRALQDKVEDYISEEILNGVIKEGQEYKIIAVEGEIQIEQPTEQIIEKPKRGRKKKGDE